MTKKGKVRVETTGETPRIYDVRKGEKVTVKTKQEKPEVTGGGGGNGDVQGALGCLFIVIVAIVIVVLTIGYFINRAVNLVESSVMKKVNPTYKTRVEATEEEIKEKTRIADEEAEKQNKEIENSIENIETELENFKRLQIAKFINQREVEDILYRKGFSFRVGYPIGFCVSNTNTWICGDLFYEKESCYYPAIAFSDDNGKDFKILRIFKETGQLKYPEKPISTLLLPVMGRGYLSIYGTNGYSVVYKTDDKYPYGWEPILTTANANRTNNFKIGYTKRIRVLGGKVSLISSFQKDGFYESIESNDEGDSWTYKRNYKPMATTHDKGLTWGAP